MLIDWADSADNDLLEIRAYFIRQGDEATGKNIVSRLIKAVNVLEAQPLAGKAGRIDGTRELIPRKLPYVLVYQIPMPDMVEIIRVIHTSRLFPESLFEKDEERTSYQASAPCL